MSNSNEVAVFCAATDNYSMPMAAMIRSAAENLNSEFRLKVYACSCGISSSNRLRIEKSLMKTCARIEWLEMKQADLDQLPDPGRYSIASFPRLFCEDLVPPSVRRLIYLDIDLIVLGDLAELWKMDLKGDMAGAVQGLLGRKVSGEHGIEGYEKYSLSPEQPYFNTGVMLFDLEQWRRNQIGAKLRSLLLKDGQILRYKDQDVINIVLANSICPLPPEWNQTPFIYHFQQSESPLGETEHQRTLNNPKIIHYATAIKPWQKGSYHPKTGLFERWIYKTDWATEYAFTPFTPRSILRKILNRFRR